MFVLKGKLSAVGTIQSGVPQGNIFGPLPFCIFTNDLSPHKTNKSETLFADDSSLDTSWKPVKELKVTSQNILS